MNSLADEKHLEAASRLRDLLYSYEKSEDLINIGAYKKGSSKEIDQAIEYYPKIIGFLKQKTNEKISMDESIQTLLQLMAGE